jgi:hypothetical protein
VIYGCYQNEIYSYDFVEREKKVVKEYGKEVEVLEVQCSMEDVLVVLGSRRQIRISCGEDSDDKEKRIQKI